MSTGPSSADTDLLDCEGRLWPRITKENAAQHEAPKLRDYHSTQRGPTSPPYCWYVQISGEATWDQSSKSYRTWKQKWDGWMGANARRAEQMRASNQQLSDNRKRVATREANEAQQAAARVTAREQDLQSVWIDQLQRLDAHAHNLVLSLLESVDGDGSVPFHGMLLGTHRTRREQLMLMPAYLREYHVRTYGADMTVESLAAANAADAADLPLAAGLSEKTPDSWRPRHQARTHMPPHPGTHPRAPTHTHTPRTSPHARTLSTHSHTRTTHTTAHTHARSRQLHTHTPTHTPHA